MIKCLETNKVCSAQNKKCKVCKLDDCNEVLYMIETQEEIEERYALKELKKQLPEECQQCTVYEVIDVYKKKVYCPYKITNKCIIKD